MKYAVTNHAVERYQERVAGAKQFDATSVRRIIRSLVDEALIEGAIRDHPHVPGRRIIPFTSSKTVFYLSLGKNETGFTGDFAVIGVLYEKEITEGKIGVGVTLGDLFPALAQTEIREQPPEFVLTIRTNGVVERYDFKTNKEMVKFLVDHQPKYDDTNIYVLFNSEDKKSFFRGLPT